jgi:hypothetical protein
MTVYMKDGEILGRELYNFYNDPEFEIKMYSTKTGDERDVLVELSKSTALLQYTGDYVEANGFLTGTATILYVGSGDSNLLITADVSDFRIKDGFLDGGIAADLVVDDYSANATALFEYDGTTQWGELGAVMTGDLEIDFGKFSFKITPNAATPKITPPEIDSAHIVNLNDTETNAAQVLYADIVARIDNSGSGYGFIRMLLNIALSQL